MWVRHSWFIKICVLPSKPKELGFASPVINNPEKRGPIKTFKQLRLEYVMFLLHL